MNLDPLILSLLLWIMARNTRRDHGNLKLVVVYETSALALLAVAFWIAWRTMIGEN
jgi:membrane associated rhomboid family serine protease